MQNAHRLGIVPVWNDRGFVFTNAIGNPIHPNTLHSRFRTPIVATGVPKIRFHDLRHTCATLLLAEGVHPKIVQERLGHADIAITLNRYSHVTPTMQRQAAETIDGLIARVSEAAS